jgi:hypothetical protein
VKAAVIIRSDEKAIVNGPSFPWSKLLREPHKVLFYAYFYIWGALRKLLFGARRIGVIGDLPPRPYLTWKIFRLCGVIESRSTREKVLYRHIDRTFLENDPALVEAINGRCIDISKMNVEHVFEEVFGYSLAVDPTSYHGPVVEKSDENATHDGRILTAPFEALVPGKVYEILVDNSVNKDQVLDYRACIIGHTIPLVYKKFRPRALRFTNTNTEITWIYPEQAFVDEEIELILQFSRRIGLDVGELDILRDVNNGRIYIVDANKTPHSPNDKFIGWGGIICMHRAAWAFSRQYLSPKRVQGE